MRLFRRIPKAVFISSMLAVLSLFGTLPSAFSLPQGGQVEEGSATFEQPDSNTLNITTSDIAIINWNSFSIAQNETVNFYQPLSSSSVLNRVLGGGISDISGALNANGSVILVNPAGISFAPTANINVGSLIASSLNISSENFMAGNYVFENESGLRAGMVINAGNITSVRPGGLVAMLGGVVENSGQIVAQLGNVALVAGNKITLSFDPQGMIQADVTEGLGAEMLDANGNPLPDAVKNIGRIIATGGKIIMTAEQVSNVFSRLVNMTGYIEANSVIEAAGRILLVSDSGLVTSSGEIHAEGLDAGTVGGEIKVLGQNVFIDGGLINASGDLGGGTVLIGGNFQGKGPELNAQHTYVSNASIIKADAVRSGNGGKVILWGDQSTQYYGSIFARGGSESGDGGFAEVSGKEHLDFGGQVDLTAANGKTGTLLLDPRNVTISGGATSGGAFGGGNPNTFTPTANGSVLNVTALVTALNSANVIVTTGSTGTQQGDITISSAITAPANANSLTITAADDIFVNAAINFSASTGGVTLTAAGDLDVAANISTTSGAVALTAGGAFTQASSTSITTTGSSVTISGDGVTLDTNSSVSTSGGAVTISSTDGISQDNGASISTSGGNVILNSVDGDAVLEVINAGSGSITINISATGGGNFDIARNSSSILLTADTINFNANTTSGTVGKNNARIATTANTINATAQQAGIFITETDGVFLNTLTTTNDQVIITTTTGNLTIGSISAGTGAVTLTATAGSINDNANDNTADITGGTVTLTASSGANGIGTSNGSLDTDATSLVLTAGSGGINIHDIASVTITSSTIAAGGSLQLAADGTLTLSAGNISVSGAGVILLSSGADFSAPGTLTSAGGSITLSSAGTLTLNNNITSGGGAINITADSNGAGGESLVWTAGTVSSSGGTVNLTVGNGATGTGTANLRTISAGSGAINVTSAEGSILEAAAGVSSLTGGTITLNAGTGAADSVGTAANTIKTTATTINATSGSGGIFVTESDGATLNSINSSAGNGTITTTSTTGNLLIGTVNAGATGAVNLTATAGSINDDVNDAAADITGGTLTLTASAGANGIGTANGSLDTDSNSLVLSVGTGGINIHDIGSTTFTTPTIAAGGSLIITADATLTLPAANIALSGAGIITLASDGGNLSTNGTLTTASGNISLSASGTLAIAHSLTTTGGQINLTADSNGAGGESLVWTAGTLTSGGGAVNITVGNGSTGTGTANLRTISAGAGVITVISREGSIVEAVSGSSSLAGSTITLTAGTGAGDSVGTLADAINTTATTINATSGTGGIFIDEADGATISGAASNGGNILINSTTGDLSIGTVNASAGNVTLNATAGDLLDATSSITGATLNLTAGGADGDIGVTGTALNTTATTINATATGTGEIVITETNGATLNSIVTAGGQITVVSTTGDLTVTTVNATTAGNVTLTSTAGDILNSSSLITANTVSLTGGGADGDVGQTGSGLNVAATTINATATGTGEIVINETDGATLGNVMTGGGNVAIVSATGDLLIGTVNAGAGDVTLTATTGSINDDVDDAITDITGNTLNLTANAAGQGIGTANGSLDTDATTINMNVGSGGINIHDVGSVTLGTPTIGAGGSLIASADGVLTLPTANITLSGAGSFDLSSLGGNLRTRGNLRTTGTGTITLSASGNLRIDDNLRTAGGVITLTANSDGAGGGNFNWTAGTIRSFGGNININVGNGVSGNGDIELRTLNAGTGDITLTTQGGSILEAVSGSSALTGSVINFNAGTGAGDSVGLAADPIKVLSATTINALAGSGGVFITQTAGDFLAGSIRSIGGDVTLTATAGDILDAGSLIRGNAITLTAGGADGDIGQTGTALNTRAASITATATGTGEIVISEFNGITLTSITTGGGPIDISNGAGDISVGIVNAGAGNVTLTSARDILDAGSLITGGILTLAAAGADGDVGQTGAALNVAPASVVATATGTGEIVLNILNAVILTSITTAGGDVNVSVAGDMTVGTVSGGAVTLTTTAGGSILDGNGAANNLTATAGASLTSAGIIGTGADPLDVMISGGTLTVSSGGIDLGTGISVDIDGTVAPINTLTVPVRPTGLVIFNGVDLFPAGAGAGLVNTNLLEDVNAELSLREDLLNKKTITALAAKPGQYLRVEYQP